MNKKDKAVVQELIKMCCHITGTKEYQRIHTCLADLNSKTGNIRSMKSAFESAMDEAAKLCDVTLTKKEKQKA